MGIKRKNLHPPLNEHKLISLGFPYFSVEFSYQLEILVKVPYSHYARNVMYFTVILPVTVSQREGESWVTIKLMLSNIHVNFGQPSSSRSVTVR